jgi:ATP-dependent Lon protease
VTTPETLPNELPLLALRSTIVFPHGTIAVQVGAPDNVALLKAHPEPGTLVALAIALGDDAGDPSRLSGRVGVLARVREHSRSATGTVQVTLEGLSRVRIGVLAQRTPYPIAAVETLDEVANSALSGAEQDATRARMSRIVAASEALVELNDQFPAEVPGLLRKLAKHPSPISRRRMRRCGSPRKMKYSSASTPATGSSDWRSSSKKKSRARRCSKTSSSRPR